MRDAPCDGNPQTESRSPVRTGSARKKRSPAGWSDSLARILDRRPPGRQDPDGPGVWRMALSIMTVASVTYGISERNHIAACGKPSDLGRT